MGSRTAVNGNIVGANAQLAPLGTTAGQTQTMALLAGSPAVGAGNPRLAPATDQRGITATPHPTSATYEFSRRVVVTTLVDEDDGTINQDQGSGTSLREAIAFADKNPGVQTIEFAVSGTLLLSEGQLPDIASSFTISGPAAGVEVNAQINSNVFVVDAGVTATFADLTIVAGSDTTNPLNPGGGAIINDGTLTVADSTLAGNTTSGPGGAILNRGTLTVVDSSLIGNESGDRGGAIWNTGSLTLARSTLVGNAAFSYGGAVYNSGTLLVIGSTLSGNQTNLENGGGGIFNEAVSPSETNFVLLNNSLIASSTGGDLESNTDIASNATFDLIDDAGSAAGLVDGAGGNIVGHTALLGPLAANGGPTLTMALLPGSPAIDAGSSAIATSDRAAKRS